MIIGILIACFLYFGGGRAEALAPQFDHAESAIKKDVHDEARRKEALRIVGEMKSAMEDYSKSREKSVKAVGKALDKREVSADELHAVAAPLLAENKQVRDRMLDLQFELRKVLTAAEWAEVYPPPARSTAHATTAAAK